MIRLLRQIHFVKRMKKRMELYAKKIPFSPTEITVSGVLVAFLGFLAIYLNQLTIGLLLFLVAGLFDALDGAVARSKKQVTSLGFFLDGVSDRAVEFFFISSFLFLPFPLIPIPTALFLLLFLSLIIPYVKSYAEHSGALDHNQSLKMGGFFERSERMIAFYLILIFSILNLEILSSFVIAIAISLSLTTFLQRIFYVRKRSSKNI